MTSAAELIGQVLSARRITVVVGIREHQEERGLSAHHLILLFLAGVAVCGVFFSLGFLVGFNERFSRSAPPTERVTAPAAIPPAVNPPAESVKVTPQESTVGRTPGKPAPDTSAAQPAARAGRLPRPRRRRRPQLLPRRNTLRLRRRSRRRVSKPRPPQLPGKSGKASLCRSLRCAPNRMPMHWSTS